jgi:Skp family chaperone for outer membrane proteins
MKKLALALTTVVIIFSFLLAGCEGGISQEVYDGVVAQLTRAKEEVAKLQDEAKEFQDEAQTWQEEKEAIAAEIEEAQAKVAQLEAQVSGLKEQFELVGATPSETAEKIVRYYHETHVYSTYDYFVCSDMASEVWNMLKAQGIDALIVVGNKDTAILDILESNHAWVLAEVAPGEYLALETTAGRVVQKSENPLYYRGWSFKSPRELKSHNELVREYNLRIGIHNDIVDEANAVLDEYNQATKQATADKLEAIYEKLVELVEAQEAELNEIASEIDGLATELR